MPAAPRDALRGGVQRVRGPAGAGARVAAHDLLPGEGPRLLHEGPGEGERPARPRVRRARRAGAVPLRLPHSSRPVPGGSAQGAGDPPAAAGVPHRAHDAEPHRLPQGAGRARGGHCQGDRPRPGAVCTQRGQDAQAARGLPRQRGGAGPEHSGHGGGAAPADAHQQRGGDDGAQDQVPAGAGRVARGHHQDGHPAPPDSAVQNREHAPPPPIPAVDWHGRGGHHAVRLPALPDLQPLSGALAAAQVRVPHQAPRRQRAQRDVLPGVLQLVPRPTHQAPSHAAQENEEGSHALPDEVLQHDRQGLCQQCGWVYDGGV
mmetsp:Transcript_15157/g.29110  ORF Transcript_15157/g.29110 Transcript_15157/m.29110 type:complete len:317 (+) Transcript_15157:2526-3476(+)